MFPRFGKTGLGNASSFEFQKSSPTNYNLVSMPASSSAERA
jgi:hypothetical protein